jgi:hypothetical protein
MRIQAQFGPPGLRAMLWVGWLAVATVAAGAVAAQKPVDFNHPPREYVVTNAQGWTVLVERELIQEHPELAGRARRRLDSKLAQLRTILPPHTQPVLLRLKLFLMLGEKSKLGGRNNGAEYFQRTAPAHFAYLDPRMASSVVIYSAENYVWLSDFWARKVLFHELAHAWHLEQWAEAQPNILQTYRAAKEAQLYGRVPGDDGRTLEHGYAATNQLEYFAELSCMYFVGCHYYPFNRAQLRAYDPAGEALIRKMWSLGEAGVTP